MVLNHTQRNTVAVTLDPYLETLREIDDPNEAIKIFQSLSYSEKFDQSEIQSLVKKNKVVDEAKLLNLIFRHPCPQNRTMTNWYIDEEEVCILVI
jgi:hypothetical protein